MGNMYTNIENYNISRCSRYTFIPEKFYLMNLNVCMPKVGFWTIKQKTQQIKMTTDD